MEWLVIGAVIVVVFFVVSGQLIGAAQKQQEQDPDKYLDEWFDGREQVIVERSPSTLSAEAILAGGNDRGYRLISSEQMPYPKTKFTQMIFERTGKD